VAVELEPASEGASAAASYHAFCAWRRSFHRAKPHRRRTLRAWWLQSQKMRSGRGYGSTVLRYGTGTSMENAVALQSWFLSLWKRIRPGRLIGSALAMVLCVSTFRWICP